MSSKTCSGVKEKADSVSEIKFRFFFALAGVHVSGQTRFVKENFSRCGWSSWFCRGSEQG